ncbi:hypothetical protein HK103_003296 [Boothiomyces macroporosus]|uniref:Uncharacterized protein n=1 Tax=Boothiomyces macroporosus TaxID=261099 RepID=A0AAD5Y4I2_9FUNG|nr:hypothetical protein HK103_003296 [Boothiomyces macroporosus]
MFKFLICFLCAFGQIILKNNDYRELYRGEWRIQIYRTNPLALNCTKNYALIHTNETILLSLLEVKTIPSLKYLNDGKVYTFEKDMYDEKLVAQFMEKPVERHFNYLPLTWSYYTKWQLDLFFYWWDLQDYFLKLFQNYTGYGQTFHNEL